MKNNYLIWIVLAAAVIGVGMVVYDLMTKRRGALPENGFAYSMDAFSSIDTSEIGYREIRRITIRNGTPRAMTYANESIYLLIDNELQVLTPQGKRLLSLPFDQEPVCVTVSGTDMVVGFRQEVRRYDASGSLVNRSAAFTDSTFFSAVAVWNDKVYVADAGEKMVRILDASLQELASFKGESGVSDLHGFILPSLHFELAVNADGELWVVNPGMHALQNYASDGTFRGQWGRSSFETFGFSGCCNPSEIAFLSDGSFVTSEKGLVRIKVHKPSGELLTMVAPPEAFPDEDLAPDIAVDKQDNILVLDLEQRLIRFFSPKAM